MAANEDTKVVSDHPTVDENKWFSYAVTLAIFTAVAAIFSAVWVFSETDPEIRSRLASTLVPFGTVMIAAVTFCTVAWRGLVGSRQADQQKRQNDASDDANFAKLLQEGAKLIADDKTPNQIAGVASLDILLTEPQARYAHQARNVLAESMRKIIVSEIGNRHPKEWVGSSVYTSIHSCLVREAREGRFSNVDISLEFDATNSLFTYWPTFVGFKTCTLTRGGVIRAEQWEELHRYMVFDQVSIVSSTCNVTDFRYRKCKFDGCTIVALDASDRWLGGGNTFTRCDFTNCAFEDAAGPWKLNHITFSECWFDVMNPPKNISISEACRYMTPKFKVGQTWRNLDQVDFNQIEMSDDEITAVLMLRGWENK